MAKYRVYLKNEENKESTEEFSADHLEITGGMAIFKDGIGALISAFPAAGIIKVISIH